MFKEAYLKDKDGRVVSIFYNNENSDVHVKGTVVSPYSWDDEKPVDVDFFAHVYLKWDGCSHLYFRGEDYSPEETPDSYYHTCGVDSYIHFMRQLHFIYEVMVKVVGAEVIDEKEELQELRNLGLLKDYTIEYIMGGIYK